MSISRILLGLLLATMIFLPIAGTAQQPVVGRVIDRNGAPQPRCVVEFYLNRQQPPYTRIAANNDGYFNIALPPRPYSIRVVLGPRQQWFDVTVDGAGLHPPTIVVSW